MDELLDVTLADLRRHRPALVASIVERTRRELPTYADLPAEALTAAVSRNVEQAIEAVRNGRGATEAELELARELGRVRADEGVPVEHLLHAYRVGVTEAWSAWARLAVDAGIPTAQLVTLSERVWRWADEVMLQAAAAHHEGAVLTVRRDEHERGALLRGLLLEGLTSEIRALAERHGLDLAAPLVPLYALPAPGRPPDEIERAIRRPGDPQILLARAGDALMGVAPGPLDLASEAVVVGLGPAGPAERLLPAYALAVRVASVGRRRGLRGTVTLDDVSLLPAVAGESEIGEHLHRRLLAPLSGVPRLGDQLLRTIEAYLEHGQRIDDAAGALFMHRNTLRNRLRLIERLTGADLGRTDDVVEFWWALRHAELRGTGDARRVSP